MSENYTLKVIFINDIYFRSEYTSIGSYKLLLNDIIQRINFLLYNKSNNDIWNINAQINFVNFDHVVIEYNIENMTYYVDYIIHIYTRRQNSRDLPKILT